MKNEETRNTSMTPGLFLKQYGFEEVYVYKEDSVYNGTVLICELDDRIKNKGGAQVVRGFTFEGEVLHIFLESRTGDVCVCEWIVFDYIRGEFFIGVSKSASSKIIFLRMDEIVQMTVQQKNDASVYLPPA